MRKRERGEESLHLAVLGWLCSQRGAGSHSADSVSFLGCEVLPDKQGLAVVGGESVTQSSLVWHPVAGTVGTNDWHPRTEHPGMVSEPGFQDKHKGLFLRSLVAAEH